MSLLACCHYRRCAGVNRSGADAVKVGIGPGSICTTRIVAGAGVRSYRTEGAQVA